MILLAGTLWGEAVPQNVLANAPAETEGQAPARMPAENPDAHRAFIFEIAPENFSAQNYKKSVEKLIAAYEKSTGRKLVPAETKKAALKIYTASGIGLATPKDLTRAARDALEKRGFARENILIVDLGERTLRQAGYLPPFRRRNDFFWEKSPVIALDNGEFYDKKWFYESSVPAREGAALVPTQWEDLENERKSFLPVPLLFGVDFWINLPVVCDSPVLGVSGALANATLWNASNQKRFLENPASAAHMAVSIATIPEFKKKFELTILSLEKYQFVGGPVFNENYTLSEKEIWLSANPVILDYLMWMRLNTARQKRKFDLILPEPPVFYMASKGATSLGSCASADLKLIKLEEKAGK